MSETIPPEILVHQNRISPELREFISQTLEGRFTNEAAKQLGRIFWSIIDDPIYEHDDELRYLASKLGVMVGQYDLSIKCMNEDIAGTKVWGSVAMFEIGEVDEAFSSLQEIIESEYSDIMPVVEAIFWVCYLKMLVGDTENLDSYKNQLEEIFDSRQARLLPKQMHDLKIFVEGLIDIQSANNIAGIRKIEEFLDKRKEAKDQYWQLISLLTLGEQKLDSSDFISSEKIFTKARILSTNLANVPLTAAVDIGMAHVYYLKGELKKGNILSAQTIDKLLGLSQYYLVKAQFIRGQILIKLGHHKIARDSLNLSYSLAQQYRDHNKGFMTLLALADSYIITNEKEEAQKMFDKAYSQVTNIANKRQFTQALVHIAEGDYRQGNIPSALNRINQIETLSEEIQYQRGKTDALRMRAQIAIHNNENIVKQIFILEACQVLYLEVGNEESNANCDVLIAEAFTRLGNIQKAEKHLNEAKNFYLKISDSIKIAEIKELQAAFDIQTGKFDEALVKLRSSYSHYSDVFDRNKRVRCLRKIADILAIKGDFKESISRYKKVQSLLSESENEIDNAIINFNKARVNFLLDEFEKANEDFRLVERFLIEKNLKDVLKDLIIEKALIYITTKNEELLTEVIEELRLFSEDKSVEYWIQFIESLKFIHAKEYETAYSILLTALQNSLTQKSLLPVGILYALIKSTVELNIELLNESFLSQEINNYIGLLQGIVTESNFYYLKGLLFLVDLLWQYITQGERDYNEIVVQASEYYASTGIEEFANKLLNLQYNIGLWQGQTDTTIQSIFGAPQKYDTPEIVLTEIIDRALKSIFIENLIITETRILQNIIKLKEKEED